MLPRSKCGISRVEKEPNITGFENDSPFLVGRERQAKQVGVEGFAEAQIIHVDRQRKKSRTNTLALRRVFHPSMPGSE